MITPSGTGSASWFEAGAELVCQSPVRTAAPGATGAVGSIVSETMWERPAALTPVTILRTLPGIPRSPSRLLQGELHEPVSAIVLVEVATGGDDLLELRRRNRQPGDHATNAACLLGEVPDELAARGLIRVALTVPGEDRDPWPEERHLVGRDQRDSLHQIEHLRRIVGAVGVHLRLQHREASLHDAVGGVVRGAAWLRLQILAPARKRRARVLRLEPVHDRLDALHVLVGDVVLLAQLRGDVDVGDVVAGRRVDAVERLEEHPALAERGGDLVEARLRVADEAVGEAPLVVAGVRVIEAGIALEHGLAPDVALPRQRDREHRVTHCRALAQRTTAAARALEVSGGQAC